MSDTFCLKTFVRARAIRMTVRSWTSEAVGLVLELVTPDPCRSCNMYHEHNSECGRTTRIENKSTYRRVDTQEMNTTNCLWETASLANRMMGDVPSCHDLPWSAHLFRCQWFRVVTGPSGMLCDFRYTKSRQTTYCSRTTGGYKDKDHFRTQQSGCEGWNVPLSTLLRPVGPV
jgi:hypothetical protein